MDYLWYYYFLLNEQVKWTGHIYLSKPVTLQLQMWCVWHSFSDMLMNVHKAWFELEKKIVRYFHLLTFLHSQQLRLLNDSVIKETITE